LYKLAAEHEPSRGFYAGRVELETGVLEWQEPLGSMKPGTEPDTWNIDFKRAHLEMSSLLTPHYENTDTFIFVWPSPTSQLAHGGAEGYRYGAQGEKRVRRGVITIPGFRMI
jgi:hypothetical protein